MRFRLSTYFALSDVDPDSTRGRELSYQFDHGAVIRTAADKLDIDPNGPGVRVDYCDSSHFRSKNVMRLLSGSLTWNSREPHHWSTISPLQ